jgi:hypothetical protein
MCFCEPKVFGKLRLGAIIAPPMFLNSLAIVLYSVKSPSARNIGGAIIAAKCNLPKTFGLQKHLVIGRDNPGVTPGLPLPLPSKTLTLSQG